MDKNSAIAHAVNGEFRFWFYWDFKTVENEYQIFKRINPSNSEGNINFVDYLWAVGRFREAERLCEVAFEQNKTSPEAWVYLALAYYYIGEIEKSFETIETALRLFLQPNSTVHDQYFVFRTFMLRNALGIFVRSERYKEAIALFEKNTAGKELKHLDDDLIGTVGIAYFKTGNKSRGTTILNELLSRNSNFFRNQSSYTAASMYIAMNEKDKALQYLKKAYNKRELVMPILKVEPLFLPLHGDPRFEDLLVRIGFK